MPWYILQDPVIPSVDSEGPDQNVHMRILIKALAVQVYPEGIFSNKAAFMRYKSMNGQFLLVKS